ncbi:hypothetical protein BsWGS_01136 [Bradybaena similaris]
MSGHTHTVDLAEWNEFNSGVLDAEESWTEPLNPGTNTALICSDFIHKPAVSKIGHSRTIIHFDIDCFYAQVEMLRNPELQNKPLGIQQKNIVVTTNYIARQCGVPKSTYVSDAKKICPDLVLVCGEDLTSYRQMSYRISQFLQKYTPCVERLGFDENFLDASKLVVMRLQDGAYKEEFVGHVYHGNCQGIDRSHCQCGCELRLQIGSQIAAEIREDLHKELGITSCAGIGHNKLLAKLVAGTHKPNQQTTLLPHSALDLVSSFSSVVSIPGIGYKTSYRLNALGISSVVDLQAADKKVLVKEFGPLMAQLMDQLSCGVDDSLVVAYSQPQTLSDEDAFKCCKDIADAEQRIRELTTNLLKRIAEDGRIPQTVRLTIRRVPNKYHRETRQCPVPSGIFTKFLQSGVAEAVVEQLMPILMNLFSKLVDPSKAFHLTLIGVCFAKMKSADEQGSIDTFFTKADSLSQCAESNAVTNKTIDNQPESKCQWNSKSSLAKQECKIKPEAKIKTMKHFFAKANIEAHSASPEKHNTAGWKTSQESPSHRSAFSLAVSDAPLAVSDAPLSVTDVPLKTVLPAITDVPLTTVLPAITDVPMTTVSPAVTDILLTSMSSAITDARLAVIDAFERSLTPDCITRQTTNINLNSLQPESKDCSTDFPKTQQDLKAVVTNSHTGYTEVMSAVLNSNGEIDSTQEYCLQKLLSAGIDVKTIVELPLEIQNEVLLQYGIYVEDLPQGRRFVHISSKARTRSNKAPKLASDKVRSVSGAKDKRSTKRSLELSGVDADVSDRNSKHMKMVCTDDGNSNNESFFRVTLPEIREQSRAAETVCEKSDVRESLSCVVRGEQQDLEITAAGHSSTITQEKVRTNNVNIFSLCSSISRSPDKQSHCVGVSKLVQRESDDTSGLPNKESNFVKILQLPSKDIDYIDICHLPGKESCCTDISHLSDNEFACVLPGQHNKAVPNEDRGRCIMRSGLQSSSRLASYSSVECQEPAPVAITPPGYIPSQPGSKISTPSNLRKGHQNKLPDSVDSEVFSSLPSNIRGEIMAHAVMGTLDSAGCQHVKLGPLEHNRNMKQSKNSKNKNQNSLLTYFKRNNTEPK